MATKTSIAGGIMNFMGVTGSPHPSNGVAPRIAQPDDTLMGRQFTDLGQVVNSETWSNYATAMQRPTTYSAMLQTWREMAGWDLIAAALVQVVDEAIQRDDNKPGSIWYECDDSGLEDDLNGLLELLNVEDILPNQLWFMSALGNAFEKIEYTRGDGVTGLSFVDPQDVRRYWLEKNRQCVGFRWDKHPAPDRENFWLLTQDQKIDRVSVGGDSTEKLWYPWDFLHFRRMYRMRESEHGEPIFDEAQAIYKKMRIALDQMVVHRAQVQPDRYVVNVDTGEQPPTEQMRTLQRWKQMLRSKMSFGQGTPGGGDPTDFKSFYNALGLDSVLWVARPKGYTHAIEKLAGTASVPDIYDVELLTNLFFSVIGMPKEWLGIGDKGKEGGVASGRALLAQDVRFLRKIKALRRPIINGYQWLGYYHLLLKGKDVSKVNIRTKMSEIGSLDEQIKLEIIKSQAEVLQTLGEVMDKYHLPREAWIEVIFKKYMHLPDDVVNAFITALPNQQQSSQESKTRKSLDTTAMINEVRMKLSGNQRAMHLTEELQKLANGDKPRGPDAKRYTTESVARDPAKFMKSGDVIVSSYGPVTAGVTETSSGRGSGWRRFDYGVR